MLRSLTSLAFSLALVSGLSAQATTTIPDGYASTPGVSFSSWPFGLSGPNRLQYLYDKDLAARPVTLVNFIAFRPAPTRAAGAKAGIELEIKMSHSPFDIFTCSTTWATNHGNDVKSVFTKKTVNIPAQVSAPIGAFSTEFKLDSPFLYAKVKGNFLVDYITTKGVAGAYSHDGEWNKAPTFTPIGNGCKGVTQSVTGARPTALTGTTINTTFTMAGGPSSGVAIHIIGAAKLAAPVPLPFGGCPLEINPLLVIGVPITSGGASITYQTPVGLRTGPTFEFFGQFVAIDSTGPWTSSPAQMVSLGGFVNCGRILNTASATSATAQRIQIGFGIIHRVR